MSTVILQEHTSIISSAICFLLLIDFHPEDTLTLTFFMFSFVNVMTMLLGSGVVKMEQNCFSIVTHFIIAYHISLVKDQTNYCNNNLSILDVKQLNKIIKLYHFHTLKALWDGQGKSKMYYGMSSFKNLLSGKRSIVKLLPNNKQNVF